MKINVLAKDFVAASFKRLREQKIHPLFAGYLHLQQRAGELNQLFDLKPKFLDFFDFFFRVGNHPLGAPYIRPFNDTGHSLWLNKNVAGSYAPSSIRPGQPFSNVVEVSNGKYSLRKDHAELALKHLLHGKRISALHLAVFLYRDFGFSAKTPTIDDVVDTFRRDFGYTNSTDLASVSDFDLLFYREDQAEKSDAFETIETGGPTTTTKIRSLRTTAHVRSLDAKTILGESEQSTPTPAVLARLSVEGMLSFREKTTLEFGRLNLFVGPNGSGKSNVIDCLRIFASAPTDIQVPFRGEGFESWLHNSLDKSTGRAVLELTVRGGELGDGIRHSLRLGVVTSRVQLEEVIASESNDEIQYFSGSYRSDATLLIAGNGKRRQERELLEYSPFLSVLSQVRDLQQYPEVTRLASWYSGISIYSDWSFGRSSRLREAASTDRINTTLGEQMADLPAALNAIEKTEAHEKIKKLLPELKESYVDYVTNVMFGRVGLGLVETSFKTPVPAKRLSDGTLRFLALAAILLQPDPPRLIIIEEPELGMHPDMIRMVAGMLKEAATKTQLIITTHSEHLLTAIQDDFDALFAFNSVGDSSSVGYFDRETFIKWRSDHPLGKLWTSGELGGVRY